MPLLKGKTAVITGASRGIGADIARKFADEGANLLIAATNESLLNQVKDEIERAGIDIEFKTVDISDSSSFSELIKYAMETFGAVDILVNNAGITRDKLIMAMKDEDWDTVLNVNLKGTFNGIKAVTRAMLKAKKGTIINITSVVGITGNAGQANYSASKAGIIGLTKSAAKELASRNIRVNAIAPGYIETDMTDSISDIARENFIKNIPLGKSGTGSDVANLAAFLASEESNYITGQVINVDGGLLM
ncbi:MAG: 3-oxoacyl-[acyl-carrier-protein] reductase [Candidatus Marinimicrobia bacterium]|nr:3-oxoacyl-[acyl-carrier-protein] reductase [Candidatus Neomarinimicrobiota bacterium]MCH7954900.1 3-oxoacyl-[acyl-carrier-protein] reductase [Candidatus Neomarinimicrobiota bacterium]